MKTSKFVKFAFGELPYQTVARHNPEWEEFVSAFRSDVKRMIKGSAWELVNISPGHFYVSGFLRHKPTGQYAYINVSDVRHFPERWNRDVLVRLAEHEKDYTGGRNTFCEFRNLLSALDNLCPLW